MADVSDFRQLARLVCFRHFGSTPHRDDLVQAALLRLFQDMKRRPNDDWTHLAYSTLHRGMQDELRRMDVLSRKHRRDVNSGECVLTVDDGVESIGDETFDTASARQEARLVRTAVEQLSPLQRLLITAVLQDRTQREIATDLGVTESRVSQFKLATFRTMRTRLCARGIHR